MTRQKGFSIVEIVIVLAVVALIGLLGWRVWSANQTTDTTDTTQSETVAPINSEEDLNTADQQLDATNIEGSESQQLDTETSF